MIEPGYARAMAFYNAWQNRSLYAAAAELSNEALVRDTGAFFGSILNTLNHLLWADKVWMSRFSQVERPDVGIGGSTALYDSLDELSGVREAFDQVIVDWAMLVQPAWLAGPLTWFSGAAQAEKSLPAWLCVAHFFNHQTHHRGQIHGMLTAAGCAPEDTDLFLMPGVENL